jgi:hypothetical protein
MLFHVVEKGVTLSMVLVLAVFFFWKQNTPFLDPHASVPVPVPNEWLIHVVDRNITPLTVPVLVTLFK